MIGEFIALAIGYWLGYQMGKRPGWLRAKVSTILDKWRR